MATDYRRRPRPWTAPATVTCLFFVILVSSGCSGGQGTSNAPAGNAQTQTRDVHGFDSVEFASAGRLTISQAGTDSLQISADNNILPKLTSEVTGTTLRLGVQPGADIGGSSNVTYVVSVRQLKRIVLSGAGDVNVTGINGPDLSVTQNGAGKITVSGQATKAVIELSGKGDYDGRQLASDDVQASVSGAGTAVVNASHTLVARVTGIGSIEYLGDPKVTQEVTGVGNVTKI